MTLKFINKFVNRSEVYFAVGQEENSGCYYILIPYNSSLGDYSYYYEIDSSTYNNCPDNIEELKKIAFKCRSQENEEHFLYTDERRGPKGRLTQG